MSNYTNQSNIKSKKQHNKKNKMTLGQFHFLIENPNINDNNNDKLSEQINDCPVIVKLSETTIKPKVNFWEERKKQNKAIQASKTTALDIDITIEEINKIIDDIEQLDKIKISEEQKQIEEKEFITVTSKRQKYIDNKNRISKIRALELARQSLINDCIGLIPTSQIKTIRSNILHMVKYQKVLEMDISDDNIIVELEGKTFEFSRIKFLKDKSFRYEVREHISKILPEAWISFFEGHRENTFCLCISKHNNN